MSEPKHKYNLKIRRIPKTELKFKTFNNANVKLPETVDLRPQFPHIYDQGNLGSCTANALCSVFTYETIDENIHKGFDPSRLFLYYNERLIEGSVKEDSGALISDGIKSLEKYGVCSDTLCPYIIENFTHKPTKKAYQDALNHKAVIATNIHQDLITMKTSLYNKNPFVVGIAVYESFESDEVAKTGYVPMPDINKEKNLGGHAVCVCGYTKTHFIVRNSWGINWGDKGYFYIPNEYLLNENLTSELWNISKIK